MLHKKIQVAFLWSLPLVIAFVLSSTITNDGFSWRDLLAAVVFASVICVLAVLITQYSNKRMFKNIEFVPDESENVVKEAVAIHFKGKATYQGKLVLTDKRLVFKSRKYNSVPSYQDSFSLDLVKRIETKSLISSFQDLLFVEFATGEKHRFAIDSDAQSWRKCMVDPA